MNFVTGGWVFNERPKENCFNRDVHYVVNIGGMDFPKKPGVHYYRVTMVVREWAVTRLVYTIDTFCMGAHKISD